MLAALEDNKNTDCLTITEAKSLLEEDFTEAQLQQHVHDVDVVVSCLGHTLDFQGIWGHPGRLVTDTVRRLTIAAAASPKTKKFVLMGSDGVSHPDDNPRPWLERAVLSVLRYTIPPHADNEDAAAYMHNSQYREVTNLEWTVVRPTNLIDEATPSSYTIYDKPPGSLFGSDTVSRATVAKFMIDLIQNQDLWKQYSFQMPVLYPAKQEVQKE
jgi:hypothetical protein